MIPFRSERSGNGVTVEFFDRSNRYFGDYHRVCVEIRLQVPRPDGAEPLIKSKLLERMGVAGADVEAARIRLADDYWQHAGPYLTQAAYPARLIAAEAASRRRPCLPGFHHDVP